MPPIPPVKKIVEAAPPKSKAELEKKKEENRIKLEQIKV